MSIFEKFLAKNKNKQTNNNSNKSKIEQIKLKIEEESIQIPLIEKKIGDELERLSNGDKSNESPVEK